jgi:hypothetical protein
MKILALNAYQLQDLLGAALSEHKLMVEWLQAMETQTLTCEDQLVNLFSLIEGNNYKK